MPPHAAQISERALLENRDFLRLLARKLVYDEHAAEDVVQQAWLAALERPPRFQGSLRAWLAGVVRNVAFSALKREGEREERESRAARAESIDRDEAQDFEQQQLVMDSVHALRQPYRSTIYLRYYRELSPGEIAELQGISVATVKTRLRRGLEQLRADLDRRHGCQRSAWCVALAPFAGLGGIAPPSGAWPVASVLKGLILMNKTVLSILSVVALAALASVAWYVNQTPAGDGVPPGIAAPTTAAGDVETGDLAGAGSTSLPDGGSGRAEERSMLAAGGPGSAAAGAERTGARIVGRVLDDLGRPIEGADVALYAGSSPWVPTAGLGSFGADMRAETRTDAQGRFTLPRGETGNAHLAVGADGYAPFRKEIAVGEQGVHDAGELRLDPGVFLSGRVIDPAGRAVAGAEVRRPLRSAHGEMVVFGDLDPTPVVAVTDAAGRFRVARQAVGPWKLRIQSEDHPPGEVEGQTDRPGERVSDLVVTLAEGYEISGQVVGLPAGGKDSLVVRAVPVSGDEETLPGIGGLAALGAPTATVSADGSFRLRGLEGDRRYCLQLRARGPLFNGSARSAAVDARPGDGGITLVYAAPAALAFQVVDGATGLPLTDFEVQTGSSWLAPHMEDGEVKRYWPEGRVRIENFRQSAGLSADDSVKVQVSAVGYEAFERGGIVFSAGEEIDLGLIRLKRIPVVRVEVYDDLSGVPIEGATVSLIPEGEVRDPANRMISVRLAPGEGSDPVVYTEGSQQRSGVTDEDGICVLNSLPGQAAMIRVRAEDFAPYSSEVLELPRIGDIDHLAPMLVGSTLEVLVVDSEGQPLPGLRVQHKPPSGVPWSPEQLAPGGGRNRVSDSEGRILFANLEEGVHRFRLVEDAFEAGNGPGVRMVGGPQRADGWQELLVAPGEETTLTLVAAPRGDLEGLITEAGVPLAGATLRLLPAEESPDGMPLLADGPSATTDSKGHYLFENLKVDEYRLEIGHESRAMPWEEALAVRAGRNEEDFDLPVTIVEGRVTDAQGEPVVGARVTVERWRGEVEGQPRRMVRMLMVTTDGSGGGGTMLSMDGPKQPEVRTDDEGNYGLRGVRTDSPLVVKVSGEGFAPRSSEKLELDEGEVRRGVDLTVKPAGAVEVTLKKRDGSPASGILVRGTYLDETESAVEPVTSFVGPDGMARLSGCLAGKWRVSFDPMSFPGQEAVDPPEAREVEVKAGETERFEVTVE